MEEKRRAGISSYLCFAFGIAWGAWGIASMAGLVPGDAGYRPVNWLAAFAPALAAIIVRALVTQEYWGDMGWDLNFLRHWPKYVFAWLLPAALMLFVAVAAGQLGIAQPDFSMENILESLPELSGSELPVKRAFLPVLLVVQFLINAIVFTPVLLGEELGWRGHLQLKLFPKSPLLAAVATGLIWGIWHYPLNLQGYNFPANPYLGLLVFPISAVLLSIILGWLRLSTGSIWAASLGHAAFNTVGGSLSVALFSGTEAPLLWVSPAGLLALIPLGLVAGWIVISGRLEAAASS
jgi:membrane protease YdiL (CAAX protease family)